ncbi:Sperm-associated antigen 7 [Chamberlinius hualienensis]
MDLLGSILNSMDKPPTIDSKQRKILKKQQEAQAKHVEAEKTKLIEFRDKIEKEINELIKDSNKHKHKFEPMDKTHRSITHDVSDVAGLTAFSFGIEEMDRYVIVFKKEFAPSDEELAAYRRGEEWDPEKAKVAAQLKEQEILDEKKRKEVQNETVINKVFKEKHEKRQGREAAKDAEKIIVNPNRQFGFVSSENKRDLRSIEQTLADIRAKKKQKVIDNQE